MTIYDRIKTRREQLGMSQQELAEKLGYKSRSAINKIESGSRDISQSKISAFASALNTTPSYLMGWDEDEPVTDETPYSVQEMGLIKKYRQLPDSGKQAVDTMIDSMLMMAASQAKASENNNTIILAAKGGGLTKKELTPEQVDKLKKW